MTSKPKRSSHRVNHVAILILVAVVLVLCGATFDIWYCLIGGIGQIVRGATTTPVGVQDVVEGAVRAVLLFGVGTFVTVLLALGILAAAAE